MEFYTTMTLLNEDEEATTRKVNVVPGMDPKEQKAKLLDAGVACFLKSKALNGTATPGYCPLLFDNVMCWDEAPPGTLRSQPCPNYISGFNTNEFAYRNCSDNGTWYAPSGSATGWTDFGACVAHIQSTPSTEPPISLQSHMEHGERIRLIAIIGYGISLVALVMAVFIMGCSRGLKSKSNILHFNLFIAFIMRASLSFVIRLVFVDDVGLEKDVNRTADGTLVFIDEGLHWECRSLFALFMYSICASQMWIFMEATYVFMLIYKTILTERNGVKPYIVVGWSLPIVVIVPWILVKTYLDNTYCWNIPSKPEYHWIFNGPMFATVVFNFIFFLNICQVLCSKVRSSERHMGRANRRLAKFILVLIPLFGLFYIVLNIAFPMAYSDGFDLLHMYVEMTYNSFQGFLLALLFCFLNEEVHSQIKRLWWRRIRRKDSVATRSFILSSFKRQSRHGGPSTYSGNSENNRTSSSRFTRGKREPEDKVGWFTRLKRRALSLFGRRPSYSRQTTDSTTTPIDVKRDSLDNVKFDITDDDNMKCRMTSSFEDSC